MENDEVREQLRQVERGEAAGWIEFPPTPWWVPAYFGLYAALLTWSIASLDGWRASLIQFALIASAGFVIWRQRQIRGTWPTASPPRELRTALLILLAGAVGVCLLAWAAFAVAGLVPAMVVAGLSATATSWVYERAYVRGAEAARRRLA